MTYSARKLCSIGLESSKIELKLNKNKTFEKFYALSPSAMYRSTEMRVDLILVSYLKAKSAS